MRAPLRRPSRSTCVLLAAVIVGLAFAAGACSRRPPTSPAATAPKANARRTGIGVTVTPEDVDGQIVLTLAAGADVQRLAADYGLTLVQPEDCTTATVASPAGLSRDSLAAMLARDPRVRTAEPDVLFETAETQQQSFGFDDGLGSPQAAQGQRSLSMLRIAAAQLVSRGDGITVAILDTGIDPTHPLFQNRLVPGHDFVDNDDDPTDVATGVDSDQDGLVDEAYGHGTHVAGIVAMTAPGAQLMIVRVLDSEGYGDMRNVAAGIRWATTHGARIINLSLGSLQRSEAVSEALEAAREAGVVIVAAAGNRGTDVPAEFPARAEDVIAVAAEGADRHVPAWTSYGRFVALAAPGIEVRSAYPGNRWYLWSGTSMSAPFVSGTVALLLAVHPGWSSEQVVQRLQQGAHPVVPATPAMAGLLGAGSLGVGDALAPDANSADGN